MSNFRTLALWLALCGSASAGTGTATVTPPAAGTDGGWRSTAPASTAAAAGQATGGSGTTAAPSGPQPGQALPPPSSVAYDQAQATLAPLTPDEIRQLRALQTDQNRALATPGITAVPRISAQTVSLQPGASLPLVRTAVNWPATVSFIDSTGAPWKILGDPVSGSPDIDVKWIPGMSFMVITAKHDFVNTLVTVGLEGLAVPLQISVMSGEADTAKKTWTVDARLDLRIPRRGPGAAPDAPGPSRIGLHDDVLQAFLDGVPPSGAKRLKTTGSVPDTAVWQQGDELYIRSRADIRDEFDTTLSSADGTHLWKLPLTPRVAFSVDGRTEALSISLE
ncbi:intracellular multiplication protein IcmK [Kosakonia radicincitans]|uniref:Intracellular multiplication protein IcmK n=2 Tax=Kosakonia radicincitans TaxID=283686 RepID=A0AAX2EZF3_9ENTR|nr:intracellular multiplication protein IcmK [Kosakonia radicincitans]SFR26242.1 intracellular multiplication protein IcmK [Kosakonia radicincitans]SFU16743.1 intracellular multiplication protein IcmK [Kosakonia radicincitans]SFY32016.1 intracellular multiplication protein IcmK [Kosakonia radicincitans]